MTRPVTVGSGFLLVVCWVLAPAGAQQDAWLSNREVFALLDRAVALMDSTRVAAPELGRAGAPLAENARQVLATMRETPGAVQDAVLTYRFLHNLRAYLAVAEVAPKPFPLPEEARRQFVELREAAERLEAHFQALLARKEAQLRNPDRDNLRRYAEANAKLGPPAPGRPRVVFLGDSITDGWRLQEYFPDRDFVNRGISGQITGEMLGRMKADVIDLKPEAVVVLAGTNDIARGVLLPVIQNNLTMIADLAQAHGIKPLFASLLPVSDYHKDANPQYEQTRRRPPETIRALNQWLERFCRERNFVYVDYHSKMADAAGMLEASLSDDGLHPNAKGYRVMAPIVLEAIERALKPVRPAKKGRARG